MKNYFTFTLHTQITIDISQQDKDIFKFRNSQKITFSGHHQKAVEVRCGKLNEIKKEQDITCWIALSWEGDAPVSTWRAFYFDLLKLMVCEQK